MGAEVVVLTAQQWTALQEATDIEEARRSIERAKAMTSSTLDRPLPGTATQLPHCCALGLRRATSPSIRLPRLSNETSAPYVRIERRRRAE